MAKHVLSLEVPDTLNEKILRIADTSIYSDIINIECPTLSITSPGFNYSVQFEEPNIASGFALNLTACDLEIQLENCGTSYVDLSDGIYIIKYSVSPNDIIFVEYNHLRITHILNQYKQVLCGIDIADCAPDSENAKKLKLLAEIRMYIDAAKAKVEIMHELQKGMQLYTYAQKLLSKFDCTSCY